MRNYVFSATRIREISKKINFLHLGILCFLLRYLHLVVHPYPPGLDITIVADLSRIVLHHWQDGRLWPANLQPILGEQNFGVFALLPSFVFAAVEYFIPGSLLFQLKLMTATGFALYDLASLSILRFFILPGSQRSLSVGLVAILVVFVSYASPVPQRFLGSGGGMYVLSSAISLFAINLSLRFSNAGNIKRVIGPMLFVISGLVHPMPAFHGLVLPTRDSNRPSASRHRPLALTSVDYKTA